MNQAVVFRLADTMRDHQRRWVHVVIGEALVSYDPDLSGPACRSLMGDRRRRRSAAELAERARLIEGRLP